jgi:hypothetical protein
MDTRRRKITVTHSRRSTRKKKEGRGEHGDGKESVGDGDSREQGNGDCEKKVGTERRNSITRGALPDVTAACTHMPLCRAKRGAKGRSSRLVWHCLKSGCGG